MSPHRQGLSPLENSHSLLDKSPRKEFLKYYGILYVLIGILWIYIPSGVNDELIVWLDGDLSRYVIGAMWIVFGISAFLSSQPWFLKRCTERIGFFSVQFMPLILTMYFLLSQVVYLLPPEHDGGTFNGILKAVLYFSMYLGTVFVSRMTAHVPAKTEEEISSEIIEAFTASLPVIPSDNSKYPPQSTHSTIGKVTIPGEKDGEEVKLNVEIRGGTHEP